MDTADIILRAALVGIGGTIVLDLYAFLMQRMFGVPANWKMVGRWLGHMSKGEFVQTNVEQAEPVPGALGWAFHYVIGIAYGLLLVAIWGAGWLRQPGISVPLCPLWVKRDQVIRRPRSRHVRFAPKTDKEQIVSVCPLCAISGLTQRNKRLRAGKTRDVVCSIRLGAGFTYFLRYLATSPIEERRMTLT
jgi:Protein of unknown function (DUF2938)